MLFYDDSFVFIIILRAKAPSLVTYDEAGNFVIESACSVMKFVSVTTESSLMNTFLVVCCGDDFMMIMIFSVKMVNNKVVYN